MYSVHCTSVQYLLLVFSQFSVETINSRLHSELRITLLSRVVHSVTSFIFKVYLSWFDRFLISCWIVSAPYFVNFSEFHHGAAGGAIRTWGTLIHDKGGWAFLSPPDNCSRGQDYIALLAGGGGKKRHNTPRSHLHDDEVSLSRPKKRWKLAPFANPG